MAFISGNAFKITASLTKTSAKKMDDVVSKALINARQASEKAMLTVGSKVADQLYLMMTGDLDPRLVTASRPYARKKVFGEGGGDPGSGREIVFTKGMDALISMRSGRMANSLQGVVDKTPGKGKRIRAVVGFPFPIKPGGTFGSAVVASTKIDRRRKGKDEQERRSKSLQSQVRDVILGTEKMVGRNIFRLFVMREEQTGATRFNMIDEIKDEIRKTKGRKKR